MLEVPLALGVKVTEHDPADRVQDVAGVKVPAAPVAVKMTVVAGVNVPVPLLVKLTEPVGVVGLALVSVTVAVHVVPWLIATVEGRQETVVVVLCLAETTETGTLRVVLLLPPTLSTVVRVTVKVVVVVGLKV